MRKCPNCDKEIIKPMNIRLLSSAKTVECENCNAKIGGSKKWTALISLAYGVFIIVLFIVNIPIDKNIIQFLDMLFFSGIIMAGVQLFLIPYETR